MQLQKEQKSLTDAGLTVLAISYDEVDVLAGFADTRKVTFPLLSDPGGKVIAAYGLTNKDTKGKFEGIPYPGTMIVGKDGVIRAKLFHDGYRERHTAAEIVKAAEKVE